MDMTFGTAMATLAIVTVIGTAVGEGSYRYLQMPIPL